MILTDSVREKNMIRRFKTYICDVNIFSFYGIKHSTKVRACIVVGISRRYGVISNHGYPGDMVKIQFRVKLFLFTCFREDLRCI